MYCEKCGKTIIGNNCECGYIPSQFENNSHSNKIDINGNILFGIISGFLPMLGWIFYAIWRFKKPNLAKIVGLGAVIGTLISIGYKIFQISYQ